jgi:hypothetical protein
MAFILGAIVMICDVEGCYHIGFIHCGLGLFRGPSLNGTSKWNKQQLSVHTNYVLHVFKII